MEAKAGRVNGITRTVIGACSSRAPFHVFILVCVVYALTGCVHYPDIQVAHSCEAYGVAENHEAMGSVLHMKPLGQEELQKTCMTAPGVAAQVRDGQHIRGCVFTGTNGELYGYYSAGDRCSMYHEMCHAMHGEGHTHRYEQDLANGVPMPYCPSNQISLVAGR